jgi:hypothetical protein
MKQNVWPDRVVVQSLQVFSTFVLGGFLKRGAGVVEQGLFNEPLAAWGARS